MAAPLTRRSSNLIKKRAIRTKIRLIKKTKESLKMGINRSLVKCNKQLVEVNEKLIEQVRINKIMVTALETRQKTMEECLHTRDMLINMYQQKTQDEKSARLTLARTCDLLQKQYDELRDRMDHPDQEDTTNRGPLNCPVCFQKYGSTRYPHVGTCGHSVCEDCGKLVKNSCPICREAKSFLFPRKNYLAEELVAVIGVHKKVESSEVIQLE